MYKLGSYFNFFLLCVHQISSLFNFSNLRGVSALHFVLNSHIRNVLSVFHKTYCPNIIYDFINGVDLVRRMRFFRIWRLARNFDLTRRHFIRRIYELDLRTAFFLRNCHVRVRRVNGHRRRRIVSRATFISWSPLSSIIIADGTCGQGRSRGLVLNGVKSNGRNDHWGHIARRSCRPGPRGRWTELLTRLWRTTIVSILSTVYMM